MISKSFYLNEPLITKIEKEAKKKNVTKSQLVNLALNTFFQKQSKQTASANEIKDYIKQSKNEIALDLSYKIEKIEDRIDDLQNTIDRIQNKIDTIDQYVEEYIYHILAIKKVSAYHAVYSKILATEKLKALANEAKEEANKFKNIIVKGGQE